MSSGRKSESVRGAAASAGRDRSAVDDEPLGGGVASDIRIVSTGAGRIVVKRALPKLKVAADWFSDPARSLVEVAALETIRELIGPGTVPQVLWSDPATHSFAMELVDPQRRNWKTDLMAGRVELATAARVGALLGELHARSARREDIAKRFADQRFFEELRIRPYFERIAVRNPALAPVVHAAIAEMRSHAAWALVHGDFSPKNILADGGDVTILDCEVAHWGDARFDVAFCLSHLLLKAMRRGADTAAFTRAAAVFLDAYRETGLAILDALLSRLAGCLMLARLEGDSPVDYLAALDLDTVKAVAVGAIERPPNDPAALFRTVEEAMS